MKPLYFITPALLALTACGSTTLPIVYATDGSNMTERLVSEDLQFTQNIKGVARSNDRTQDGVLASGAFTLKTNGSTDERDFTLEYDGQTYVFAKGALGPDRVMTFVNRDDPDNSHVVALALGQGEFGTALRVFTWDQNGSFDGYSSWGLQTNPEVLPTAGHAEYLGTYWAEYGKINIPQENTRVQYFEDTIKIRASFDTGTIVGEFDYFDRTFASFEADMTGSNFDGEIVYFGLTDAQGEISSNIEGIFAGQNYENVTGMFDFLIDGDLDYYFVGSFEADKTRESLPIVKLEP